MVARFDIDTGQYGVVAAYHYAGEPGRTVDATCVLAPGAGAPQSSPFMVEMATALARRGIEVVTFNFCYMERGRRAPDPAARLAHAYRSAIDAARERFARQSGALIVGGKSMGGRIASQVVAADPQIGVAGLVFLGYPLHPPGRPERRRDAHLASIAVPMLFVQGSRDPFGTEAEMQPVAAACAAARLHIIAGGDHSLKIAGKEAPSQAAVLASVADTIVEWLSDAVGPSLSRLDAL